MPGRRRRQVRCPPTMHRGPPRPAAPRSDCSGTGRLLRRRGEEHRYRACSHPGDDEAEHDQRRRAGRGRRGQECRAAHRKGQDQAGVTRCPPSDRSVPEGPGDFAGRQRGEQDTGQIRRPAGGGDPGRHDAQHPGRRARQRGHRKKRADPGAPPRYAPVERIVGPHTVGLGPVDDEVGHAGEGAGARRGRARLPHRSQERRRRRTRRRGRGPRTDRSSLPARSAHRRCRG